VTSICHSRVVRPSPLGRSSDSLRRISNAGPRSIGSRRLTSIPAPNVAVMYSVKCAPSRATVGLAAALTAGAPRSIGSLEDLPAAHLTPIPPHPHSTPLRSIWLHPIHRHSIHRHPTQRHSIHPHHVPPAFAPPAPESIGTRSRGPPAPGPALCACADRDGAPSIASAASICGPPQRASGRASRSSAAGHPCAILFARALKNAIIAST